MIEFIDTFGNPEEGIDGGGLMKEFMTQLTKNMFDPQYGFFIETADRALYPNKLSAITHPEYEHLFEFFGMVVGKALYEGTLLNANFSRIFLNKMVEKSNQVDDLKTLDAELYENLLKIKYYDGNFEDLGLYMSVSEDHCGLQKTIELVKGGANIPVTNENRLYYISSYSHYMMDQRTYTQTK